MAAAHVLIIGAGITGLVLAQALIREGINFTVVERDPDRHSRGKGWALYLHWALPDLLALLPQHLIDRLPETYVDPDAAARGEVGRFPFFDLRTGKARWHVPPTRRVRLVREKLRQLLLEDVDVQWGKELVGITQSTTGSPVAHFSDSWTCSCSHIVGCDGTTSKMRSLLCSRIGTSSDNSTLPVRFLGATVILPAASGRKMQDLDPYFFQGGDPKTDAFMFFSLLDTPSNNDRQDHETYECQVMVGWPYRAGFLGHADPVEVPSTDQARLQLMKDIARSWSSAFRIAVDQICPGTPIRQIRLQDWLPSQKAWDNISGRATLIGDAAHAMTMFRGEAANHGIADVKHWMECTLPVLRRPHCEGSEAGCGLYEEEMVARTRPAVLLSRQACLDAHDHTRICDSSPLVSKRAALPAQK